MPRRLMRFLCQVLVCAALGGGIDGWCGTAAAQERPVDLPPPRLAAADRPKTLEQWLYVPYRNLKEVFERDGATVFMPYQQFLKMWNDGRTGAELQSPPVRAVLTEADYTGTVEQGLTRVRARYTVRSLASGWTALALPFGEAAIGKFSSPDERVLLQGGDGGAYTLLLPEQGEYKVEMELSVRVRTAPDGRSFELDVPASAVTTLTLTVPQADQTIEVSPAGVPLPLQQDGVPAKTEPASPPEPGGETKPEPPGETSTTLRAALGASRRITARWYPRVSTAPVMETLASVQNLLDVRIADGAVHTHATLTYQVLRGQMDQLRIAAPVGDRVLDVSAPGIKAWKAVEENGQQVITVDLLTGDGRSVAVDVHTERALSAEAFEVAGVADEGTVSGIHAVGGVRESGLLALSATTDLQVNVERQSGLVRVESGEVPEALRRPEASFFRYYSPKFRLTALVRAVEPRLTVEQQSQVVFGDEEIGLTADLKYSVEKAGVFELRCRVPDGLLIDRVEGDAVREHRVLPDGSTLSIALRERKQGAVAVRVVGHQPRGAGGEAQPLPVLEPLGVERETGSVFVFAPESLELNTDRAQTQGVQPSQETLNPPRPDVRQASAWAYTRRPVQITVSAVRRPTRLSATVGTQITARQDLVQVETHVTYTVEYAGISTFQLAIPEDRAGEVQIDSADPGRFPLQQRVRGDADQGWVPYTITLQREATGGVPLRLRYDLRPEFKDGVARFSIAPVRALGSPGRDGAEPVPLAGVTGEVLVVKDRTLAVSTTAPGFEAIDVRELTTLPQDGAVAYRYFKQPGEPDAKFAIDVSATQHDVQEVLQTVVLKAATEAVFTEDRYVTYRCRYLMKSSERQRLLVELPKGVELLETMVAERSVPLGAEPAGGNAGQTFSVNVSRATAADVPFTVLLIYRVPYDAAPLANWGGGLAVFLPRWGGENVAAQRQVAVQQQRLGVWVPERYALVSTPERFTSEQRLRFDWWHGLRPTAGGQEIDQWFGQSAGAAFAFSTAGRQFGFSNLGGANEVVFTYWRLSVLTWAISSTVLILALVLAGTSWENRLTVLLLAGCVVAMIALQDGDQVLYWLSAARFGLLFGVGVWVVRGLLHTVRRVPRTTAPAQAPVVVEEPVAAVTTPTEPTPESE